MFPAVSSRHADFRVFTMIVGDKQAPVVPKYSAEDTSLVVGNEAGETTVLPVPAGSRIDIDIAGLHYNRKGHVSRRAHSGRL